jgi:hypothetical protein
LLAEVRRENPADPFWHGVRGIRSDPDGVAVEFRDDYVDPPLYDVGDVKVACLKYRGDAAV